MSTEQSRWDQRMADHEGAVSRPGDQTPRNSANPGRSNSNALVVIGLLMFFFGGFVVAGMGAFLIAILGVGLVVAGIVIRPRT